MLNSRSMNKFTSLLAKARWVDANLSTPPASDVSASTATDTEPAGVIYQGPTIYPGYREARERTLKAFCSKNALTDQVSQDFANNRQTVEC